MRRAVLLVNLGTPDAPTVAAVRRYLREFLSDPRVVDMHPLGRWLLLNLVILPFRPARSAHAYQSVWTPEGSPLMVWSERQRQGLAPRLGGVPVLLGMRYGSPSLDSALRSAEELGVQELVVLPLFPQWASATTGSVLEAVYGWYRGRPRVPALRVVPAYFDHPAYLGALAQRVTEELAAHPVDHVVFSYHGLPERQVKRVGGDGCLAAEDCCARVHAGNAYCYRAQCLATTRALVGRLGLSNASTSFQSRLGRLPWLRPSTEETLLELVNRGVKRVAVVTPGFAADCLETLEELGLRAAQRFRELGGESLRVVPCLNADEPWLEAMASLVSITSLPRR